MASRAYGRGSHGRRLLLWPTPRHLLQTAHQRRSRLCTNPGLGRTFCARRPRTRDHSRGAVQRQNSQPARMQTPQPDQTPASAALHGQARSSRGSPQTPRTLRLWSQGSATITAVGQGACQPLRTTGTGGCPRIRGSPDRIGVESAIFRYPVRQPAERRPATMVRPLWPSPYRNEIRVGGHSFRL